MRAIHISNDKSRDAQVGFEVKKAKNEIVMCRKDGLDYTNSRFLKSTIDTEFEDLMREYGTVDKLAESILAGDPEVDMEKVGMNMSGVRKIWLTAEDRIAYKVSLSDAVFNVQAEQTGTRPHVENISNVNNDIPIKWTGKLIPKEKAVRMFAFLRKYQIKHINGLTFDFLYDMAKTLQEKNSLMLVGGGPKGTDPVVMSDGGTAYRAFLEGRVDGDRYCLILHLSNLELKTL